MRGYGGMWVYATNFLFLFISFGFLCVDLEIQLLQGVDSFGNGQFFVERKKKRISLKMILYVFLVKILS